MSLEDFRNIGTPDVLAEGQASLTLLGLLAGHCDTCNAPVDYCLCTPGTCQGCTHCEPTTEED